MHEDMPKEETCFVKIQKWRHAFDGLSTYRGNGAGVVLHDPDGTNISLPLKLDFMCSNNKTEYEVLVIGVIFALQMGICRLQV